MSINDARNAFTTESNDFTARLEAAQEEVIAFMNGETAALFHDAFNYYLTVRDNPERAGKNFRDMVDLYPGGYLGLAGAGLTVLKALAAKRKAAKKGPVSAAPSFKVEDDVQEAMRRHPSSRPMNRADRRAEAAKLRAVSDEVTTDTIAVAVAPPAMIDLPKITFGRGPGAHRGALQIPEDNRPAVLSYLRAAVSNETSALRDEKTVGGEAAIGYLLDLAGMLRKDPVDLHAVVSMIDSMGDSVSVPAQEVSHRMLGLLIDVTL